MTDNKPDAESQDTTRIDVTQDDQLHQWATKLDTTAEQIREAVKAVGDSAADVEMHLKGTHATTNADQEARADSAPKNS